MKKLFILAVVLVLSPVFTSHVLAQGAATGNNGNGTPQSNLSPQNPSGGTLTGGPATTPASPQTCPDGTDGECSDIGGVNYECDTSQKPYVCVAADTGTGTTDFPSGHVCQIDGQCGGNLACINGVCQIDPSLEDTGTSAVGGACIPANNNSDCPGDQTCQATSATAGTCVGVTNTGAKATDINGGFVPLAPIPGLTQGVTVNGNGLLNFLNNLYKYLIGLAGALAVIYIIWGGLEISTKDNVGKHTDGRKRIEDAILGLVLILMPVIVFSVINPSILNLSLNLPSLNVQTGTWVAPADATPVDQTLSGLKDLGTGAWDCAKLNAALISGGATNWALGGSIFSQATSCVVNTTSGIVNTTVGSFRTGIAANTPDQNLNKCAGGNCQSLVDACSQKGFGSVSIVKCINPTTMQITSALSSNGDNATKCNSGDVFAVQCTSSNVVPSMSF